MTSIAKKVKLVLALLLVLSLATLVDAGPRKKPRHGGGGGGSYSVAEPASLALLGMGLVSLGLYAKRKKDQK